MSQDSTLEDRTVQKSSSSNLSSSSVDHDSPSATSFYLFKGEVTAITACQEAQRSAVRVIERTFLAAGLCP